MLEVAPKDSGEAMQEDVDCKADLDIEDNDPNLSCVAIFDKDSEALPSISISTLITIVSLLS